MHNAQNTLVAIFDNRDFAERARDELLAAGFDRDEISLSDASADGPGAAPQHESFGSGIRHFFARLFGGEHADQAKVYAQAVARGQCVLSMSAHSEAEIERASDIVERYGPVGIDEPSPEELGAMRSAAARRPGIGAAQNMQSAASRSAQQAAQGARQAAQESRQGAMQQGTEQKAPVSDIVRTRVRVLRRILETPVQAGGDLREDYSNVRLRPPGQAGQLDDSTVFQDETLDLSGTAKANIAAFERRSDELSFLEHWENNFALADGTLDDYLPAYRYGAAMARSEPLRAHSWSEMEPALQKDWQAKNPDSAWDSVKAAIRHGWELASERLRPGPH